MPQFPHLKIIEKIRLAHRVVCGLYYLKHVKHLRFLAHITVPNIYLYTIIVIIPKSVLRTHIWDQGSSGSQDQEALSCQNWSSRKKSKVAAWTRLSGKLQATKPNHFTLTFASFSRLSGSLCCLLLGFPDFVACSRQEKGTPRSSWPENKPRAQPLLSPIT